ncbi:hypothetical protein K7W42_20105 [Deinococcus sp. HMF7604]|uniref:hypothetical protein n=1 Tax=Deinococcus betulae TaxID=2873312 RepID=UPI001CC92FCB|nr:hypothetical protein [Deinococcus betulae]MBZ9753144.1 hypothetical protein [Deinococcus betulae]
MEVVLDSYAQPYDALRPVICFNEKSYQLLDHVRDPLPPVPRHQARVDHKYKRCGTVHFFVALEPLTGQRTVTVTDRRGNADFAVQLQCMERFTNSPGARSALDAYPSSAVPTPSSRGSPAIDPPIRVDLHASWLNMVELEWSALQRQCLGQRVASKDAIERELHA